jgi:hypothetical protein
MSTQLTSISIESIVNEYLFSYRQCISQCTHTLIDEIWSSLLEHSKLHLIVIQLLSALLNGYRLFDLNIPRVMLIEHIQVKYDQTLNKLREQVTDSMVLSLMLMRIVIVCFSTTSFSIVT